MASLDPNWFYSTLAQSTAAIVGLGGGFLVQRILQQRNEIAVPRSDLYRNTQATFERVRQAREQAGRVAASLASAADEGRIRKGAGFGDFRVTQDIYVQTERGDIDGRGNGLAGALDFRYIDVFENGAKVASEFRDALPATFDAYVTALQTDGRLAATDAPWLEEDIGPVPPPTFGDDPFLHDAGYQRNHFRHRWQRLQQPTGENGAELREFRSRIVPASLYGLLAVLSALLLVGTILPMLYLSARGDGSRLLLLTPFAILSLAFFGFIAYELRALRLAGDFTKDTF